MRNWTSVRLYTVSIARQESPVGLRMRERPELKCGPYQLVQYRLKKLSAISTTIGTRLLTLKAAVCNRSGSHRRRGSGGRRVRGGTSGSDRDDRHIWCSHDIADAQGKVAT